MKIAFLSNFTVTTLAQRCAEQLQACVYVPQGFDVWAQELLDPASGFHAFSPDIAFILLDAEAMGQTFDSVKEQCGRYLSVLTESAKKYPAIFFAASTLDVSDSRADIFVLRSAEPTSSLCASWDRSLVDARIGIVDTRELTARFGRERVYSRKLWYLGGMKFSPFGERLVVREIIRIAEAFSGRSKKCLIVDLDNTLWGGIIGEDGLSGITLSRTGEGAVYRDFQTKLKHLKDQGVMLAIVSKNNEADALDVFTRHRDMVLRLDDFVARVINWDLKPSSIERVARQLNIGLDSVVFLDDSPVEREQVRITLPQVTVPDFPQDSAQLPVWIDDIARDWFLRVAATDEDRRKTEMYRAESARSREKQQYSNFDDYLVSLDMKLSFCEAGSADLTRAAQLTQKTNQFNLTVRRYSESDIITAQARGDSVLFLGELTDRFGSYGKIAFVLAEIEKARARIVVFLMSCRAMGRQVEYAMLNAAEDALRRRGVTRITAEYVPSERNRMVAAFWDSAGYTLSRAAEDGSKEYTFDLSTAATRPTHVEVIGERRDE